MKKPFENDQEAMSLGEMSVENGQGFVLLHGQLTLRMDKQSLGHVEQLLDLFGKVKLALQDKELPDVAADGAVDPQLDEVANPFL